MTTPKHGGKRRGAGRPRKPTGEKYVQVTVSLPPELARNAQLLGGGSYHGANLAAIRRGILKLLGTFLAGAE